MAVTAATERAASLSKALLDQGFSPFFGTPCGILAPLYSRLQDHAGLMTIAREDNAVGIAVGSAAAGNHPVVLMQNSGLGQSVNAIASLVVPYSAPVLLVISMRGTGPDLTPENRVMGRLSEMLLVEAGLPVAWLDAGNIADRVEWSRRFVVDKRMPAALLVPPALFGWRA